MNIFEPKVLLLMTDMHMARGEFEKLNACAIIYQYDLRSVFTNIGQHPP